MSDPLESVIILQLIKYFIAAVGLLGAVFQTMRAIKLKGSGREWITWGFAFIQFYWAFYYIQSLLGGIVMGHQIWVRIGIFVACSLITSCGIEAWKRGKYGK